MGDVYWNCLRVCFLRCYVVVAYHWIFGCYFMCKLLVIVDFIHTINYILEKEGHVVSVQHQLSSTCPGW